MVRRSHGAGLAEADSGSGGVGADAPPIAVEGKTGDDALCASLPHACIERGAYPPWRRDRSGGGTVPVLVIEHHDHRVRDSKQRTRGIGERVECRDGDRDLRDAVSAR